LFLHLGETVSERTHERCRSTLLLTQCWADKMQRNIGLSLNKNKKLLVKIREEQKGRPKIVQRSSKGRPKVAQRSSKDRSHSEKSVDIPPRKSIDEQKSSDFLDWDSFHFWGPEAWGLGSGAWGLFICPYFKQWSRSVKALLFKRVLALLFLQFQYCYIDYYW